MHHQRRLMLVERLVRRLGFHLRRGHLQPELPQEQQVAEEHRLIREQARC